MGRRQKKQFGVSLKKNQDMEFIWEMRLLDIVLNLYKWTGVPKGIDKRYIEMCLCNQGNIAFTKDEVMGYIMLPATYMDYMNIYGCPTRIKMYSSYTGYNVNRVNKVDATFCFNNYSRTTSYPIIKIFAERLADLDRAIDVNAGWQKTPAIIRTTKEKELSVKNAIMQIQGNYNVVIGDKNLFEEDLFVDAINCPFVGDKLSMLRRDIFYEFLTWFGVENSDVQKKERVVSNETRGNDGAIEKGRNTMEGTRKEFCIETNDMFGTEMGVEFNSDLETLINGYSIGLNKESFTDEEKEERTEEDVTRETEGQ